MLSMQGFTRNPGSPLWGSRQHVSCCERCNAILADEGCVEDFPAPALTAASNRDEMGLDGSMS